MVLGRDLGCGLDRVVAGARHDVRDIRVAGGLGEHQIGMIAEQPRPAGRRNAERARKSLTKYCLRLVARRHINQVARQQLMLVKGRSVGFEPAFVFETAFDKVERDFWQPPLCHAVQVFNIDGFVDVHLGAVSGPKLALASRISARFGNPRQSRAPSRNCGLRSREQTRPAMIALGFGGLAWLGCPPP